MRVFIALSLPESFKRLLIAETSELRTARRDLRWIEAENMHLTLAFLGDLTEEGTELAIAAARTAAEKAERFRASADGLITFPRKGAFTILAARISEGSKNCAEIAARVEDALEVFGADGLYRFRDRERRPFNAHITLARAGRGGSGLSPEERGTPVLAAGDASEIAVYESVLRREGASYNRLARIPLRQSGLT